MSIPENKPGKVLKFTPASDREALYLRRNHQQLQHFINRMLNLLGVPDKAARGISGIHGVLNGRTEFPVFMPHAFTARQLHFKGDTDEGAEKFMSRVLTAVDEAERACGRKFFDVTRADGVTQKCTSYDADYIGEAAIWGLLQARRSETWKLHPARAIDEALEAAIDRLPPCDGPAGGEAPRELPLDDYVRQREPRVLGAIEEFAEGVEDRGGDSDLILEKLEVEISRIRRSRLKTRGSRRRPVDDAARQRELDAAVWGEGGLGAGDCASPEGPPAEGPCGDPQGAGVRFSPGQVVGVNPQNPHQNEAVSAPDLLEWALWWASQGVPVLPLHSVFDGICSCRDGTECRSLGKHPRTRNGVDDATTDEGQIRAWWGRWPGANVGIAMGGPHRLVALDSDPRSGGDASVCDLVEAHGEGWLDTFTVRTGGLGHHFIFRLPEGVEACRGKLAPGIDVKAEGGYLVAAPSEHLSRRRYEIDKAVEIQEAPAWLVEELTRPASRPAPEAVEYQERRARGTSGGALILQGERNRRVFEIGCAIWGQGKATDVHDLYNQLLADVYPRCEVTSQDPFTPEDVWKVAQSIMRYPRGAPPAAG